MHGTPAFGLSESSKHCPLILRQETRVFLARCRESGGTMENVRSRKSGIALSIEGALAMHHDWIGLLGELPYTRKGNVILKVLAHSRKMISQRNTNFI